MLLFLFMLSANFIKHATKSSQCVTNIIVLLKSRGRGQARTPCPSSAELFLRESLNPSVPGDVHGSLCKDRY